MGENGSPTNQIKLVSDKESIRNLTSDNSSQFGFLSIIHDNVSAHTKEIRHSGHQCQAK